MHIKNARNIFRNFFSYPERFLTHIGYGTWMAKIEECLPMAFMDYYTSPFIDCYGSVKQSKI